MASLLKCDGCEVTELREEVSDWVRIQSAVPGSDPRLPADFCTIECLIQWMETNHGGGA